MAAANADSALKFQIRISIATRGEAFMPNQALARAEYRHSYAAAPGITPTPENTLYRLGGKYHASST